jgi:hypothetical protein
MQVHDIPPWIEHVLNKYFFAHPAKKTIHRLSVLFPAQHNTGKNISILDFNTFFIELPSMVSASSSSLLVIVSATAELSGKF